MSGNVETGAYVQYKPLSIRWERARFAAELRAEGKTWVDVAGAFRTKYRGKPVCELNELVRAYSQVRPGGIRTAL